MSEAPVPNPPQTRVFTFRRRPLPSARAIARRHFLVIWTKRLLPVLGLALLAAVALWPDLEGSDVGERVRYQLGLNAPAGAATMRDAHFSSVNDQGEPYTVTAKSGVQIGPNRINLTDPKGDITLKSGTWIMLEAPHGVYTPETRTLDLSGGVTLYRDDGTTLRTQSAITALAQNAAASGVPVSAEGPFGTLDARGFTLLDGGAVIQFTGPARLVLNGTAP